MKRTVGGSLMLGLALLTGCTMQTPTNLAVHEALFYGGNQQRVAWVYGTLAGGSESSVKLGDKAAVLRPQLSGDALGLTGTLSVDAKATYNGTTTAIDRRVSVTRVGNQYSIQAFGNVDSVFATDGRTWYRLSGPVTAGQTVLATASDNNALRGAGDLTDAEADALGAELAGQGALAVAVLPDETLPDPPLKVEPALDAGRHPVTGLYVQSGVVQVASAGPVTPIIPPVGSAPAQPSGSVGRQLAGGSNSTADSFQVIVAQNASVLSTLWNTAYGRQSSVPALPTLGAGRSVVGVFLGQRPTGGYSLSLASARITGGVLELTVNVSAPGQGSITTQALTSPWIATEIIGSFSSVVVRDAVTGLVLN
ncbi:protease complex subunit PrcB family protein [Deinococcus altitudinis]|uniref:protease complex subunit PrcB family protein n=1 Tax=Deinococcus altitudinis TaxID=468914 RepID=UPI003891FD6C